MQKVEGEVSVFRFTPQPGKIPAASSTTAGHTREMMRLSSESKLNSE